MHRPRPTFWIATATVAALALGGGVAAARDGDASSVSHDRAPRVESVASSDDTATTTTTSVPTAPAVAPPVTAGGPGNPWVEDHGADDPATHDVGDDHGGDSGSNRGPGSGDGTDDSGHSGSGHDGSGDDGSGHGGSGHD